MEGQKRSWPLKEVLIVVVVIAILALIGYAFYLDSRRKSIVSEVPGALKEITKMQLAFREDPSEGNGRYASTIGSFGWGTGLWSYGHLPQDCEYEKKQWHSLHDVIKKKKDSIFIQVGEYKWSCSKYFAYGASDKDRCADETIGNFEALAYAAPAYEDLDKYPDDWQTGACMRLTQPSAPGKSAFELHHK